MSTINAMNSTNVSFCSNKKKTDSENKNDNKATLTDKLAKPVQEKFEKTYGKDAEATPELVADFVSDNAIKSGIAILGGALLLAKSRKALNGFSDALKTNWKAMKNPAADADKIGAVKKLTELVKKTIADVKSNNLKEATMAAKAKAKKGSKSIADSVRDAILKPKKFEEGTGLAKFIDKHFPKHAQKIKEKLGKIGVANTNDAIDTALAGGATVALSGGVNEIAQDVTEKDNKALATEAKIEGIEKAIDTAGRFAEAAAKLL